MGEEVREPEGYVFAQIREERARAAAALDRLDDSAIDRFAAALTGAEQRALDHLWPYWARDAQLAPAHPDWTVWLVMAGRGFGKTRAGAEWVRSICETDRTARFALVAATYAEARAVMVEGESGIMAIAPPDQRPDWQPSLKRLVWPGGAQANIYSASEPEGLRGPQHSHAWCDEIGKWPVRRAGGWTADGGGSVGDLAQMTWDNLKMGLRLGKSPKITATTTPRAIPLVRALVVNPLVHVTRGRTVENGANLPAGWMTELARDYGGTRLGRQELDGELIEDIEGALWTRAMIDACRMRDPGAIREIGGILRVVVGVDPPASAQGDACGIVVAARLAGHRSRGEAGGDGEVHDGDIHDRVIILADASVERASPDRWARACADAARAWGADRVVAEANQGGDMVRAVLRAADVALPVRLVHASRGKAARAEPVAALYEAGRVAHRASFPRLEDELCGLLAGGGYEGPGRSPDRADAAVWALTELMLSDTPTPRIRSL